MGHWDWGLGTGDSAGKPLARERLRAQRGSQAESPVPKSSFVPRPKPASITKVLWILRPFHHTVNLRLRDRAQGILLATDSACGLYNLTCFAKEPAPGRTRSYHRLNSPANSRSPS